MLFSFILAFVPLLVAGSASVSQVEAKVTYYPKPSAWMLKPLSEEDKHRKPAARTTTNTYVNDYTYWLVHAYYSSTGSYCNEDEVIMKTAIAAGVCMVNSPTSSMMYQCWSTGCFLYDYSDSVCQSYSNSYSVNTYMCQAGDADDDGYVTDDGNQYTSQQLIVQMGFPVPLPGNSTTISYYDSLNCDRNTMNYYRLAFPNRCYNNYNGTSRTSTQYVNPDVTIYNANGCDMANVEETLSYPPGQCQVDAAASTSSMLVLNFPVIPVVPIDLGTILGTTAAAFSTMAIANTLLYFFQPYLTEATQSSGLQAEKPSEF
eukprot:gene24948-28206_t